MELFSKKFSLSYESSITDRKPVDTAKEIQLDISSASNINSPLYLIAAHQKTQRPDPANPANNLSNNRFKNAIFDHVEVRKYYSEIEGVRYPKKPVMVNFVKNIYFEHNIIFILSMTRPTSMNQTTFYFFKRIFTFFKMIIRRI